MDAAGPVKCIENRELGDARAGWCSARSIAGPRRSCRLSPSRALVHIRFVLLMEKVRGSRHRTSGFRSVDLAAQVDLRFFCGALRNTAGPRRTIVGPADG